MSDYRQLLDEVREDSRATHAQILRVQADVDRRTAPRPRAPWLVGGALLAVAAAAALVYALSPIDVGRPLDHTGPIALGADVAVDADGEGEVRGTSRAMTVDWRKGLLTVEVEPEQGVQLSVATPEGTVQVVGTGFDVDRGALGTTVVVRHGRVTVDCVRGGVTMLSAGERRTCEPVSVVGALRRVLALEPVLTPADLLAELDAALERPEGSGAVKAELLALRADTLLSLGRDTEALATMEQVLDSPDVTRGEDLHRKVARLQLAAGDCAGALPHLEALGARRDAAESAALDACRNAAPQ